jgi:hypothetical protein
MPIDVRMPDGTLVKNVPDNITQADLMARFDAFKAQPVTSAPTVAPEIQVTPQAPQVGPEGAPIPSVLQTQPQVSEDRPAAGSARKGVVNLQQTVENLKLANLMELQDAYKQQYGQDYENAPPEKVSDLQKLEEDINTSKRVSTSYDLKRQTLSKQYGITPLAQKLDDVQSTPEYQNANGIQKFQAIGETLLKNPGDIPSYIGNIGLESLPNSMAMMASAILARYMTGSPSSTAVAGGATSSFMEFGNQYVNNREQGKSHQDAMTESAVKSGVIGYFDAVSFGSAGKALEAIVKDFKKGAIKATAKEVGKETGKQAGYGAAGESVGSVITGQEVDPRAVVEEALGEIAGAPMEAVTTYRSTKAAADAAPTPPPVSERIEPEVTPIRPRPEEVPATPPPIEAVTEPTKIDTSHDTQAMLDELSGKDVEYVPEEEDKVAEPKPRETIKEFIDRATPEELEDFRQKNAALDMSDEGRRLRSEKEQEQALDEANKILTVLEANKSLAPVEYVQLTEDLKNGDIKSLRDLKDYRKIYDIITKKQAEPEGVITEEEKEFTPVGGRLINKADADKLARESAIALQQNLATQEAERDKQIRREIREDRFPAAKTPSLASALKSLGGINVSNKLDMLKDTGKVFNYESAFSKDGEDLLTHIENGSLDEYLPHQLRLSNTPPNEAFDPRPAYDYISSVIESKQKVHDYDYELAKIDHKNKIKEKYLAKQYMEPNEAAQAAAAEIQGKEYMNVEVPIPKVTEQELLAQFSAQAQEYISEMPIFESAKETKSFKIEMNKLRRAIKKGMVKEADIIPAIDQIYESTQKDYEPLERKRGAEIVKEKLLAAKRRKELSPEAVDMALFLIDKNPALVKDLAISITASKRDGRAGGYAPLARLATIFKYTPNNETAVHEILHHLERMMPKDIQAAIRKAWSRSLSTSAARAFGGTNETLKQYYRDIIDYHTNGDEKAEKRAMSLLAANTVGYEHYQNFNPSEFWAINGSSIVQNRYNADISESMVERIKNWLSEFVEKVKALFNLQSDAAVIRALNSVAKGDGKFITDMIHEGERYDSRAPFKPDVAWHAGDLGYAGQDILGSMAGRGTGHFGSGVYFVSKQFKPSKPTSMLRGFTMGDRPQNKADFRGKNMFTPRDYEQGITLHDGLKFVDKLESYDDIDKDTFNEAVHKLFMALPNKSRETIEKIIREEQSKAREIIKSFSNGRPHGYVKSLATMVMERLGYDGVDVRHIPRLDTSEYGSVVYQENVDPLSKQYNQEEKNFKDFGQLSDFLGQDKVRAIMSMPMMQDLKYRLFGYGMLNKEESKRDIFKYTKDKDNIEHIFVLPNPKTDTSTSVDIVLDKDRNVDDIKKYLVKKEENGKKDWIYIESIKDPLQRQYANIQRPPRNIRGQEVIPQWHGPEESKIDTWLYRLQNKQIDTKRVQELIGDIEEDWNVYEKEQLYHGRTAAGIRNFLLKELLPVIKDIERLKISPEDVRTYLHNRHAEERNNQMNKINPDVYDETTGRTRPNPLKDKGSGISTADARAYLAGLDPARKQVLEQIATKFDQMVKGTQQILINSGAESADTIAKWNSTYEHYVPLFRVEDEMARPTGMGGTGQGFGVRGAFSKRALGSEKDVQDILSNIIAQRERALIRAEKIRVGRALYGLAIQNPNSDFWLAINPDAIRNKKQAIAELRRMGVPDAEQMIDNLMAEPKERYLKKTRAAEEGFEPDEDFDFDSGLPVNESKEVVASKVNVMARYKDFVFPVRINGKDRYIFFNKNDPRALRMVQSLKNLDVENLGYLENIFGIFTRWFKSVNTQYNPVFGLVNFVRDFGGTLLNLTNTEIKGKQAQVIAGAYKAMGGILNVHRAERKGKPLPTGPWAKLYQEARAEGFQTGYRDSLIRNQEEMQIVEHTISQFKDGNTKKAFYAVLGGLTDYNDMMENAFRLSAYKVARDQGLSKQKAAIIAKNLTVNFDRKGAWTASVNVLYAFFNASVQGTERIYQTLKGPKGKMIIGGGILAGMVQAVMLAAAGYGDDDPPEFVRERNFIIPLVDGTYLTVPYPLGYNILPNSGRIVMDFMIHGGRNPGKHMTSLMSSVMNSFNPLGSSGFAIQTLMPTAIDPIVALAENKDSFGRPIYRPDRATAPTPGYTRSRDTASTLGKGIAEFLNWASGGTKYQKGSISPTGDEVDFLAGQVGGGLYREVTKAGKAVSAAITGEEIPSYQRPVVGRFLGSTGSPAAVSQTFYNNVTRMTDHENEIKGRRKNQENVEEYYRKYPEARLWKTANTIENKINQINKEKRLFIERKYSKERIKAKDEQKTRLMQQFNDQVSKLTPE